MAELGLRKKIWEWTGNISVAHWLLTTVPGLVAGVFARLQGIPIWLDILLSALIFLVVMIALYFWERRQESISQRKTPRKRTAKAETSHVGLAFPAFAIIALLIFGAALPPSSSVIHITGIEPNPSLSDGHETAIANIHFTNTGSRSITYYETRAAVFTILGKDWAERQYAFEDQQWDQFRTRLKYVTNGVELPHGIPTFVTIQAGPITTDQIQELTDGKAALYVMDVFIYRDIFGTHESDACAYFMGDIRVVHFCHAYNGP
jgi:hypothetical protein